MAHATQMLSTGGLALWLDRGLAAASIEDRRSDYRDWLVSVGDLYIAAHKASIDPTPALRRMAERSNPEPHRAAQGPGGTRESLAHFEQSAYFGTSVLPRLS
jgi:hypothetical protein